MRKASFAVFFVVVCLFFNLWNQNMPETPSQGQRTCAIQKKKKKKKVESACIKNFHFQEFTEFSQAFTWTSNVSSSISFLIAKISVEEEKDIFFFYYSITKITCKAICKGKFLELQRTAGCKCSIIPRLIFGGTHVSCVCLLDQPSISCKDLGR